jgi:phosphohistidine phosphatase
MSRIVYIIRHAQAVNGLHQSDAERTLTPVGVQQANRVGKFLKSKGISLDSILASPAVRARETATQIATQLKIDPTTIKVNQKIYSGSKLDILNLRNELDSLASNVMIVGHFPTIVELYSYLTTGEEIAAMDTAELRPLAFEIPWSELSESSGTPIDV